MKPAKILKEKINARELTIGAIASYHCWPGLVEILKGAGYDFLIIDFEHGPFDAEMALQTCTIGRLAGFPVLIRPPSLEPTFLHMALDSGAVGLLLPYVESSEQLDTVQEAIYLPPRGKRRPGGAGVHWVSGFHYENWKTEVEDDLIVLPQIESRLGVQNADAIAQHPITTAIATGPYDLSADLGVCWQPHHPDLLQALDTVQKAGEKAGKNIWMNGSAEDLQKRGYTFFCAGEPSAVLANALTNIAQAARKSSHSSVSEVDQILS